MPPALIVLVFLVAAAAEVANAQVPPTAAEKAPLHVAVHGGHHEAMRALVAAGAAPNVLENDRYDIVTIAAVANDLLTLRLALELGASPRNVTSRYDGTAAPW